jgi:hypothetical protein
MKHDRFLRFLHFTDNNAEIDKQADNYDRLWKIRGVFDTLNDAYEKYYNPSEHLAVEEIIVKFNCSPSIIRIIKSRRMRWTWHVARIGQRNACRILVGKPKGKRPLRRPRHRWEDNIKMDLRDIGWGSMDWIDLAQDRDLWRALVNMVMNLRFP